MTQWQTVALGALSKALEPIEAAMKDGMKAGHNGTDLILTAGGV